MHTSSSSQIKWPNPEWGGLRQYRAERSQSLYIKTSALVETGRIPFATWFCCSISLVRGGGPACVAGLGGLWALLGAGPQRRNPAPLLALSLWFVQTLPEVLIQKSAWVGEFRRYALTLSSEQGSSSELGHESVSFSGQLLSCTCRAPKTRELWAPVRASGCMGSHYEGLNGWKNLNPVLKNIYEIQFYNDRQAGFTNTCGMR